MSIDTERFPCIPTPPGGPQKKPVCKVRAHFAFRGPLERIRGRTKLRPRGCIPHRPGGLSRAPRYQQRAPGPRPRAKPGAPLAGAGSRWAAAREVPTLSSRRGVPSSELAGPQLCPPAQRCRGEDARWGSKRRVGPAWPAGLLANFGPGAAVLRAGTPDRPASASWCPPGCKCAGKAARQQQREVAGQEAGRKEGTARGAGRGAGSGGGGREDGATAGPATAKPRTLTRPRVLWDAGS